MVFNNIQFHFYPPAETLYDARTSIPVTTQSMGLLTVTHRSDVTFAFCTLPSDYPSLRAILTLDEPREEEEEEYFTIGSCILMHHSTEKDYDHEGRTWYLTMYEVIETSMLHCCKTRKRGVEFEERDNKRLLHNN